jgi:hypothetical protein
MVEFLAGYAKNEVGAALVLAFPEGRVRPRVPSQEHYWNQQRHKCTNASPYPEPKKSEPFHRIGISLDTISSRKT